jgi:hypothetical protein
MKISMAVTTFRLGWIWNFALRNFAKFCTKNYFCISWNFHFILRNFAKYFRNISRNRTKNLNKILFHEIIEIACKSETKKSSSCDNLHDGSLISTDKVQLTVHSEQKVHNYKVTDMRNLKHFMRKKIRILYTVDNHIKFCFCKKNITLLVKGDLFFKKYLSRQDEAWWKQKFPDVQNLLKFWQNFYL